MPYPDYLRNEGLTRVHPRDNDMIGENGGRTLHPRQFGAMVRNISSLVQGASPQEIRDAHEWYPKAHDLAASLSPDDPRRGATAIAALSPQKEWGLNQRMATELPHLRTREIAALRAGDRSVLQGRALRNQTSHFILQAHGLLHGEIDPDTLLHPGHRQLDVKVNNFARNINDPSESKSVTIDTHAHDAAVGWKAGYTDKRGLRSQSRYDHFANAYDMSSQRLGIEHNNVTQAAAWVRWRNLNHPIGGSARA